jgi:hypothetical protein
MSTISRVTFTCLNGIENKSLGQGLTQISKNSSSNKLVAPGPCSSTKEEDAGLRMKKLQG